MENGEQAKQGGCQSTPSIEEARNALRAHREQLVKPYGLTEREREVALMILDGYTMKGIAESLFITERTVKFHSKNAYDKLGVSGRRELIRLLAGR